MRSLMTVALALALMVLAALPTLAKDEKMEDTEGPHPLMVLRATYNNDSTSSARATTGQASIWLKNMTDVTVDGVKVTLKLVDGSRVFQTLEKEVGKLEAGKKSFLDYRWDDYQSRKLKPQIWVTYNGAGGPVTFRAEPPVW